ncbi:MAG: hypothetical protein EOP50_06445, partial [Sphingobacteriales bacterium]
MIQNVFVNPQDDARFIEQGYLVLDLLSAEDIAELREAFAGVEEQHRYDFVASVVLGDLDMR